MQPSERANLDKVIKKFISVIEDSESKGVYGSVGIQINYCRGNIKNVNFKKDESIIL